VIFVVKRHKRSTVNTPTLPASVGVKMPFKSLMMTKKMTIGHITSGTVFARSPQENLSLFGPNSGLILHKPKIATVRKKAMSAPGG
jgi:hypothetical protein